ncbi:MAG: glycosyl hydrolase, partial [Comamonadaceae bacterium]
CDSLTLVLDARTNYKASYAAGWRGVDPLPSANAAIAAAAAKAYSTVLSTHISDFSALMTTMTVDWGSSPTSATSLPTNLRLKRYADNGMDPELEQTMFAYGRYLLIGCSRPGGLPANLQGLWNNSNTPAWASDYHNNINVQMNYWGAEVNGLSDLHLPLVDFVEAALVPCRAATKAAFGSNVRGWTARTSQSIFGGNGWDWNNVASAWYAQHLYEHYAFTQDRTYLNRVYPMIKEICEFWQDRLKRRTDGKLVAPNGWSPEHGPVEDGVMYDQQIIWDLFQNYLDAARALGVDASYQAVVSGMQADLAPNKVGSWGQLQEWQTDRDSQTDLHRHTSHLFGVYPGRQITPAATPAFAAAAMVSLKARCNEVSGLPFTAANVTG